MLFNQVNPLSCMNRLNSLWEMGFGKSFLLASTMSKGLPLEQRRCPKPAGREVTVGPGKHHFERCEAQPLKECAMGCYAMLVTSRRSWRALWKSQVQFLWP